MPFNLTSLDACQKNRIKRLLFVLVAFCVPAMAHGSTVNWGTNDNTGMITAGPVASAAALGQNNWVTIGYFANLSDSLIQIDALTSAGTLLLKQDFVPYASAQVPATPLAGGINLHASNNLGFSDRQIYWWAMQSSDTSSLAAAQGSVQQQAIAYLPKAITPTGTGVGVAWSFPSEPVGLPITIDLKALTTSGDVVLAGAFITGANNSNLQANSFGPASPAAPANNALQLATVVPEPSTLTFSGLAALAAAGMRRRQRK